MKMMEMEIIVKIEMKNIKRMTAHVANLLKTSETLFNSVLIQSQHYLLSVCRYLQLFVKALFCAEFVFTI